MEFLLGSPPNQAPSNPDAEGSDLSLSHGGLPLDDYFSCNGMANDLAVHPGGVADAPKTLPDLRSVSNGFGILGLARYQPRPQTAVTTAAAAERFPG